MVLRRRAPEKVDGTPPELLSPMHPVWGSVESCDEWRAAYDVAGKSPEYGPYTRWEQARVDWALATGRVRYYGDNPRPFPDWHQIREAGIPDAGGRGLDERFEHAGVTLA